MFGQQAGVKDGAAPRATKAVATPVPAARASQPSEPLHEKAGPVLALALCAAAVGLLGRALFFIPPPEKRVAAGRGTGRAADAHPTPPPTELAPPARLLLAARLCCCSVAD